MDSRKSPLGSKDASIAKDNDILIAGLKQLYDDLLQANCLRDGDVTGVYASGMVTSPYGIYEIPHLSTPVGIDTLQAGIYTYFEGSHFGRAIYLVPGVKTLPQDCSPSLETIEGVGNLRGEEIEVFGLISEFLDSKEVACILTGSHTQIIYVKNGQMTDIISGFSGELVHGLVSSTVLSSAVDVNGMVSPQDVLMGYKWLQKYGVARALYLIHSTNVFNVVDNGRRNSLLNGIVSGSVIQAFSTLYKGKCPGIEKVIVAGSGDYIRSYEVILQHCYHSLDIVTINPDPKESFSLKGFKELLKRGRNS